MLTAHILAAPPALPARFEPSNALTRGFPALQRPPSRRLGDCADLPTFVTIAAANPRRRSPHSNLRLMRSLAHSMSGVQQAQGGQPSEEGSAAAAAAVPPQPVPGGLAAALAAAAADAPEGRVTRSGRRAAPVAQHAAGGSSFYGAGAPPPPAASAPVAPPAAGAPAPAAPPAHTPTMSARPVNSMADLDQVGVEPDGALQRRSGH